MDGYTVTQVLDVLETLSHSQGFYGRLLAQIRNLQKYEPEKFAQFKTLVEEQHFKDPVDVVIFFET